MFTTYAFRAFLVAAAFCAVSAAARAGEAPESHAHQTTAHAGFGKPGDPQKITRTITLEATEIAFDAKKIVVQKGETIRFLLVNKGEQPHELTIADADEQAAHRKMMADMDMSAMAHNDGNSVSAEPGETKQLIWTFTEAGAFEFACNYPGHAESGMEGPLIVR